MSEYTEQLLSERRANLARIAELEKALNDLLFYPQCNAEYTLKIENAHKALKG